MPNAETQTDLIHKCDAKTQIDEHECSSEFVKKNLEFAPIRVLSRKNKWHEKGGIIPGGSWVQTENRSKNQECQARPITKKQAKQRIMAAQAEDRRNGNKGEKKIFRWASLNRQLNEGIFAQMEQEKGFSINKGKTVNPTKKPETVTGMEPYVPPNISRDRMMAIYVPTPKTMLPTAEELFETINPPKKRKMSEDSESEFQEMCGNMEQMGTSFLLQIKNIVELVEKVSTENKNKSSNNDSKSGSSSSSSEGLNVDFSNYEIEF